jgi:hypothetical protein
MTPPGPADEGIDTVAFLAHAAASVRERRQYVPAGAVDAQPTWLDALQRLTERAHPSPTDLHRAHQIRGWASSLKPRDPSGYRARLVHCIASDRLSTEQLPLAASAVRAFNLHLYYEIRGRKH